MEECIALAYIFHQQYYHLFINVINKLSITVDNIKLNFIINYIIVIYKLYKLLINLLFYGQSTNYSHRFLSVLSTVINRTEFCLTPNNSPYKLTDLC